MKNRNIANMQDFRDVVRDTLGQFTPEHDTEGLAEHLLQISHHDGAHYHGRILDQGTDQLVMVDEFWALARRYHHDTVQRRDESYAGLFYEPPDPPPCHVSADPPTPTLPRARARDPLRGTST